MHKSITVIACLMIASCSGDNDSTQDADTLWVFKNTGAIQCESSGMSVEESAQTLIDNGIDVLSSNCGNQTGVTAPTVCGAGASRINLHEIREANLPDSEALGYFDVAMLDDEQTGLGYTVIECDDN